MDLSNRLALSYYKKIADLNEAHHVALVQHQESGKLFVEKKLSVYDLPVYQQLQHVKLAGVPQLVEVVEEDGVLTLIEDYVSGITLEEKMGQNDLDVATLTQFMLELCDILMALHSFTPPIIHRDIKPSNIIVNSTGNVVLLDFNAAKFFSDEKSEDTVLLGTKGYAAPEQYGFGVSTVQTDVYALGKLLQELVGALAQSTQRFAEVIKRATQLNPADRYRSVALLKQSVSGAAVAVAGTGAVSGGRPTFAGSASSASAAGTSAASAPRPKFRPATAVAPRKRQEKSWTLPGFRTRQPWKMIVATIMYLFIFYLCVTLEVVDKAGAQLWVERAFAFLMLLAIIFALTDYRGLQKIWPLGRHPNKVVRYFGALLLAFLLALALLIVMVIVEPFF